MLSKPRNAFRAVYQKSWVSNSGLKQRQLSQGRMPHPNFRKHSIILGCPTLGRQQMPMFGDIRYITFTRQTWLQDRFPCHVGLLAELCSNPEAYHLQQTLTIVWDHLLFTSGFRASSWPLHTFSSGVLIHEV